MNILELNVSSTAKTASDVKEKCRSLQFVRFSLNNLELFYIFFALISFFIKDEQVKRKNYLC